MTNEWLQWYTCKAAFEADGWKVRTATHCNLTNMERYRSGHNEAVLKTVCPQGRMGSNPILSARFVEKQNELIIIIIQVIGEVPKRLKGLPWKGSRSLIAARGFKSLLLRPM